MSYITLWAIKDNETHQLWCNSTGKIVWTSQGAAKKAVHFTTAYPWEWVEETYTSWRSRETMTRTVRKALAFSKQTKFSCIKVKIVEIEE